MYNNTSNIIICDHPLIKHKLSVIRDQETGTSEFRTIMQELAMLIGYEASAAERCRNQNTGRNCKVSVFKWSKTCICSHSESRTWYV